MKLENFLMSDEKWNDKDGIVAELMKPGRVDWGKVCELLNKKCGYCQEPLSCQGCSLDKPGLCFDDGEPDFFYLRYMAKGKSLSIKRDKRKARRIAKRIYKAIKEDDPRGK